MNTEEFKYCPICGHPLVHLDKDEDDGPRCVKCERVFYSAPYPTVSAILTDEDEKHVLLARRRFEPLEGYWQVPGGFLDLRESLEEGLRREISEELAVKIRIEKQLGSHPDIYGAERVPIISIYYLTTIAQGEPAAGSDVSEVQWFHRDELPMIIAFESDRWALNTWLEQSSSKTD